MVGAAVVVSLTGETVAAAGFYIPLAPRWHRKSFRFTARFPMPTTPEQPDFAHAKSFVLCSLQPTKSACSAAAEKCLSSVGQPPSSVSGRKRYNTLDFASKIVCQQGCCAPLLETQRQRDVPFAIPHFPRRCIYKLQKAACHPCSENTKGGPCR